MPTPVIDILMYHSISERPGPTNIAPDVFRAQMAALADAGTPVISLDALADARERGKDLPPHSVILTFDDGFQDFADTAWPVIREQGWPVTVYLPTSYMGGVEGWRGIASPPRQIMSWSTAKRLTAEGVSFGGHTLTHPDLTTLGPADLARELHECATAIEEKADQVPHHFAPPYGAATPEIRKTIARLYRTSCGTELSRATPQDDPFNLPRLEMFYFTDIARWRAHLAGRGGLYLGARRALRQVRDRLQHPWARA